MSQYNVLSIDFDFFQKVTCNTIVDSYPDPHDLTTDMSAFVWSQYYANDISKKRVMEVKTDYPALKFTEQIIKRNIDPTGLKCHTMIANSHKHLYDFIHEVIPDTDAKITIYNMDMHHDMFGKNPEDSVDCGNWANHIKDEYANSKYIWICNPISEEMYPSELPDEIWKNYSLIAGVKFDIIFLCRSDGFVPPHLDKDFEKLARLIKIYYGRTMIDIQVEKPREINARVRALRKAYKDMAKLNKANSSKT